MTFQVTDTERQKLEAGGYLYCHTCQDWYDDTGCWEQDHSRHCGHRLQPPGADTGTMIMVCQHGGKGAVRGRFVFTCPSCGDPCAQTVEPSVDLHSGAGYTCDECGEYVIFEAMTVGEYRAYSDLLRQAHEAA